MCEDRNLPYAYVPSKSVRMSPCWLAAAGLLCARAVLGKEAYVGCPAKHPVLEQRQSIRGANSHSPGVELFCDRTPELFAPVELSGAEPGQMSFFSFSSELGPGCIQKGSTDQGVVLGDVPPCSDQGLEVVTAFSAPGEEWDTRGRCQALMSALLGKTRKSSWAASTEGWYQGKGDCPPPLCPHEASHAASRPGALSTRKVLSCWSFSGGGPQRCSEG